MASPCNSDAPPLSCLLDKVVQTATVFLPTAVFETLAGSASGLHESRLMRELEIRLKPAQQSILQKLDEDCPSHRSVSHEMHSWYQPGT